MAGHAAILDILLKVDSAKAKTDLSGFDTKVKKTAADASKAIKAVPDLEVKADLDDTQLRAGIKKAKADLAILSKATASPEIDVATAGATAHLKAFETQLAILTAKDYNVDVNVDRDGGARGALRGLWNTGRQLISLFGEGLTSAMQSAGGGMSGLSTTAKTSGTNLSIMATVAGEAAAVIGVALVAAVGAGVTALVALAASAIAAAGALAALGVAAAAVLIPFAALSAGIGAQFKAEADIAGTAANDLKERLMDVRDVALRNFGPAINQIFVAANQSLKGLIPLIKALTPAFQGFTKAISGAIRTVGKELTGPAWTKFFAFLLKSSTAVVGPLTKIFIIFARVLRDIAKAAMPFLIQGLKALAHWLGDISKNRGGVKALSNIIGGLVEHLKSWWNLGKALVGIVAGIFTAAVGPGKSLVDTLGEGAQKLADWVNSAEGQERIKQFFSDVMPLVKQLVTFFGQLTVIILQLFQALAPTFASMIQGLNLILKPVIFLLELFNKIPANVRSWAIPGLLAPAIGAIVLFINIVKLLINIWQKVKPIVKAVFDWLKGAAGDLVGWIKDRWADLEATYGGPFKKLKNAAQDAFAWLKNAISNVKDWIQNAWGDLGRIITAPFSSAVDKIRGFLSAIIDAINAVPILPDINNPFTGGGGGQAQAGGSQTQSKHPHGQQHRQRGGMMVPGQGPGDKIPALLEPGEFVLNRKAVGAIGGGRLEKLNREIPRFQIGGIVNKAKHLMQGTTGGGVNLPGLSGLPDWLKPVGEWALGGAAKWIIGKGQGSASAQSVGSGGGSWATYDALAKKWGLSIASTFRPGAITSSGNASYHSMRDGPGRARATDYSDGYATRGEKVFGTKMAKLYGRSLAELIHTPLGFSIKDGQKVAPYATADHYDHVHVAFQKGGGVPQPAHGSHWIKGGNRWTVDEAATLLWQAGLSRADAAELARVVPSESGGNPRAHNPSGATGLFQILGAVRPGNLYDPRINALNAAIKWRTQGRGAWTGASTGPPGKILMDAIGGNGGTADATGTGKDKFQSAFPGIKTSLLQRLHRSLKGPAQRKLQEGIHAARMALGKAKGPAARIAAVQGLNAAKGAKTSYLGALATYQKARKSGTGVRKALEALVTMEQALTAAPEAGDLADADTSALDLENERIRSMNELISQGNLLALQGFQVSASQNPILGLPSDRFPSQTPLSPLLTSLPSAASAPAAGGGGTPKVHVHIHKKKGLDDLIDVRIQGQMKKTARKGNRRLPSGRG